MLFQAGFVARDACWATPPGVLTETPIIYIMSSSTLRIASDESIAPIPRIRTKSFHFPKIPRNLR
ncbi:hypothetical protein J2S98_003412, partial [Arthrobacter oryzae]|nr:hypothetical protein [Arthrobacter oryzae]